MQNHLKSILSQKDPAAMIAYVDRLNPKSFSLQSFIDALINPLVWESNLDFGSFHLIKMALFLRDLSQRHLLSSETEKQLAKVALQHLALLEHIHIHAELDAHVPDPVDTPLESMRSEIKDGNAHNAFFYACVAYHQNRPALMNALLSQGCQSIPDSLGHSISCFYPVVENLFGSDHPQAGTALLSLILYLCRLRGKEPKVIPQTNETLYSRADKNDLLRRATEGTSIVDLHHMITFYIFQAWENASWNDQVRPDWPFLSEWIGKKKTASMPLVEKRVEAVIPATYEAFRSLLATKEQNQIIPVVLALTETSRKQAYDWLFRAYTSFFTPEWDPHYFTGLYAALELTGEKELDANTSSRALVQALSYFLENIE